MTCHAVAQEGVDADDAGRWQGVLGDRAEGGKCELAGGELRCCDPGVVRLFTYQAISRGADGILYFFWRQPRIGPEKFYGGVLTHDGRGENRAYKEVSQVG
jgi:hypothetical protein